MNKKIIFLMCLLMAMVWTAGCSCLGARPDVPPPAPAPVAVEPPPPPPPAPQREVYKPAPVVEPSKKLKQRVIKETD